MILYTSDLHLGHANIIKHDGRPFHDCDEMDHVLIELWNGRVQPDDTVYIVGDFIFRSANPPAWYLKKMKGHKILIPGNHDDKLLKDPEALSYFERVEQMMEIEDESRHIQLCHYPLVEWNAYYSGSWHVYGHIHNRKNETYEIMRKKAHALNAGCMINNYMPVNFHELIKNNEVFRNLEGREWFG